MNGKGAKEVSALEVFELFEEIMKLTWKKRSSGRVGSAVSCSH